MTNAADGASLLGSLKLLLTEIFAKPTRTTVITPAGATRPAAVGSTHGDHLPELAPSGAAADRKTATPHDEGPARPPTSTTRRPRSRSSSGIVVLSPYFKLIFLTIVGITVIAGLLHIVLAAVWTTPTANQQSAFEAMGLAWKLGLGAVFGLLGGKLA